MIVGKLGVAGALSLVVGRNKVILQDAVRYFNVGRLREADYVVKHTPTPRNPNHVSVVAPEGVIAEDWWRDHGEPMLELMVDGMRTGKGDDDNE
ncbi:hypothetical protein [Lentzea sp.]|uniref:hypothetical protein n=1 Tax=Lentzea sp. TaxID=56099 RepID=UPI002ED24773